MSAAVERWRKRLRLDGLPPRVIVGCSGGPDSSALLALMADTGSDVTAVHVDHGLRPESRREARVVAQLARRLGVQFAGARLEVAPGPNLEERARLARLDVLRRASAVAGSVPVLLAHTMDDVAETVLLNQLRGAGTTGLAGIPERRAPFVRPMLGFRRSDSIEVCGLIGFAPVFDPMNDDRTLRRVFLRREVLPRLEAAADRDIVPVLARQAELMRDESDYLDDCARSAWPSADGAVARDLADLAPVIARRAVRDWVGYPRPTSADVERVLAVARGDAKRAEIGGNRTVVRAGGRLALSAGGPSVRTPCRFPVPGRVESAFGELEAWIERDAPVTWPDGRSVCVLDAERVGPDLVVRAPRPGERMLTYAGSRRVRDLMSAAGIPAEDRDSPTVVAHPESDAALWVPGVRAGRIGAVGRSTRRFLWLRSVGEP